MTTQLGLERAARTSRAPRHATLSFDRGTLLVEGLQPSQRLVSTELVFDRRVGRLRAPACRYAEVSAALRAAGVRVDDRVRPRRPDDAGVDPPPLRGYQRDALVAWELSRRRGIVVLPTGAGKTRVAIAAIARVAAPTIVLVPTRVLLEQWQVALRPYARTRVGQLGDGCRRVEPITIATFESAIRHMDRIGHRFDLLVADEAHHFVGGKRIEALEMCVAPMRLGLTATPPDDALELERLRTQLGPVVCRRSVVELAGTHLAPFEHLQLHVDLTPTERVEYDDAYGPFIRAYRDLRASGHASTWTAFMRAAAATVEGRRALSGFHAARRLVSTAARKLDAVAEILARHAGQRVLVFCANNTAAYAISRRFLVPAITKDIVRSEREDLLERFRTGRIHVLVSARVLNEGVDVPEVGVGIVVGGVLGKREHVQRVGRLLRPRPGKRAVVHEIVCRDTFEVGQASRRRRGLAA